MLLFAAALTASLLSAPPAPLAGRWEGSAFTLVFEANGTGSIALGATPADPFTWKAAGQKLTLTQDGEATHYSFALTGEQLTLSGGDLPGALRLERTEKPGGVAKKGPFAAKLEQQAKPTTTPAAVMKAPPSAPRVTGTCQGACTHTLQCVGQFNQAELAACVQNCSLGQPDAQRLAASELMSCTEVAAMLMQAAQQQQPRGRAGNGRKECQGCVREGDNCVWLSQSDWGHGTNSPYSGAAADCDPTCCQ